MNESGSDDELAMLRYLINFIYPPSCAACGVRMAIDSRSRVCASCLGRVTRTDKRACPVCGMSSGGDSNDTARLCSRCVASRPHYDAAYSITVYDTSDDAAPNPVAALIRRHKYGLDQSIGRALAEYLDRPMPLPEEGCDVVMPVPLHRRRLRWRGFNQSALLGAAVARRIGRPLDVASLVRSRATPPQTMRDRKERARNVRGAFAVRHPARVAGRRILLVDDVMTTGATAEECARVLKAAGARRVDVLTLARAL